MSKLKNAELDIAVLTETKKKGMGSEKWSHYDLFYSGVTKDQRAQQGVAIIIRKTLRRHITSWEAINQRLIKMNITIKGSRIAILGVYGINEDVYISQQGWWFVVFTVTLVACIISIREVYKKWLRAPVIVSFATKETPIYSIPFPAVTICPETKSTQALYSHMGIVKKFLNKQNLTERERTVVDYMGLVCEENSYVKYSDKEVFTDDFYRVLEEISRGTDPFMRCEYIGIAYDCNKIFKPVITDEGLCYTFNMLDRSEIFQNNVYSSSQLPQFPTCGHKTKAYQCSSLTMRDIKCFHDAFYAVKDKLSQDSFILKF
ncbi:pickpocket protein 28-like, partial [Diabrotica undecimpunctata]|uniref:pickpocket protein 28-like n=1 Tax=Diabrotica undecimpunctata TaxID=50387 RepID=UPI003B6357A5